MDRNIVTWIDARNSFRSGSGLQAEKRISEDDYWSRLVKYIPIEIISAYVLLEGLIKSAYQPADVRRTVFLGILVTIGVAGTFFFARRVLKVERWQQISVSAVGFLVWTFATGGFFESFAWYGPWMGSAAVILFGIAVRIIDLPPLPDDHHHDSQ